MFNSPEPRPHPSKARSIRKMGDDTLRQLCTQVNDFRMAQTVIDNLCTTLDQIKTLYDFQRGAGISAPQIGENVRISIIDFDNLRHILINPEIVDRSHETIIIREGCLSFFDHRGMVERARTVKVRALDRNGREFFVEGEGNLSSLLQHEIDHLDGILYVDRLPGKIADLIRVEGMPVIP